MRNPFVGLWAEGRKKRKGNEDDWNRVIGIVVRYFASWPVRSVIWSLGFVGFVLFVGLSVCWLVV